MADSSTDSSITSTPYPNNTRSILIYISQIPTTITRTLFSDKILLTISQEGRLAQWYQVPLLSPSAHTLSSHTAPSESLLPAPHLTPLSLLGTSPTPSLNTTTQLLSTTIGSLLLTKNQEESRTLVLGVGWGRDIIRQGEVDRGMFEGIVGGVLEVI